MKTARIGVLVVLISLALFAFGEEGLANELFTAVQAGEITKVNELITQGAQVNLREDGKTALMYAAQYNQSPEIIEALVTAGALVDARDRLKQTPLMYAAKRLAGFLGSMITRIIKHPEGCLYYKGQLKVRICLYLSTPKPFNRQFRRWPRRCSKPGCPSRSFHVG
jgi:hypothetical protein